MNNYDKEFLEWLESRRHVIGAHWGDCYKTHPDCAALYMETIMQEKLDYEIHKQKIIPLDITEPHE